MTSLMGLFWPRQIFRTTSRMQLPVVINSEEDYAIAAERIGELEFELGDPNDNQEFVAITEAMLKWEMRRSAFSDLS